MCYSSIPSKKKSCKVCRSKYQSIVNEIGSEETPLLLQPQVIRRRRCTERYTVLFVGILSFMVFLGITIGFHLIIYQYGATDDPTYVVSLASRHNWRAAHVDKNVDLAPPSNKLIIAFTKSPICYDQQNCSSVVRSLQEDSLKHNGSDLPYNFIIGGDNRIYEGRGWLYAPEVPPYSDNATIAIAFLGYAGKTNVTSIQKDQLIILVNLSISHHKLHKCFRLLTRPEEEPHLQDLTEEIRESILKTACG